MALRLPLCGQMAPHSLLALGTAVVKARVSLGTVGGTVSVADSQDGNALMLLITNPAGPKVEISACFGERRMGWRGRVRQRFRIPMHGIPHRFGEDGDGCLAWAETATLPPLEGLVQLYIQSSTGEEWQVENLDVLLEIRDRLARHRAVAMGSGMA